MLNDLLQICPEILLFISKFLDLQSFLNLLMVCKATKSICDSDYSWNLRAIKDLIGMAGVEGVSWKDIYRERSTYVLLFITAGNCSHCTPAKEKLTIAENWLSKKYKNLQFITLEMENTRDNVVDYGYDAKLRPWVVWFPCWILFPFLEWKTKEFKIGNSFSAGFHKIGGSHPTYVSALYEMDNADFENWIQDSISTFNKHYLEK